MSTAMYTWPQDYEHYDVIKEKEKKKRARGTCFCWSIRKTEKGVIIIIINLILIQFQPTSDRNFTHNIDTPSLSPSIHHLCPSIHVSVLLSSIHPSLQLDLIFSQTKLKIQKHPLFQDLCIFLAKFNFFVLYVVKIISIFSKKKKKKKVARFWICAASWTETLGQCTTEFPEFT